MELIRSKPRQYHVSHDAVEEFETAILTDPRVAPAEMNTALESTLSGATRLLEKAGMSPASLVRREHPATSEKPDRDYFAVMMDLDISRLAPWLVRSGRKSVYMFDAWPAKHAEIRDFVDSWGIQYAFVSSSQAAERLSRLSDHCTFIWVAEGVDPLQYRQRSFIERDIDVLQLGRKYDAHHTLIAPALEKAGKTYLYETEKGRLVFPAKEDFVTGLARSRISICVPSSITHPSRAGDIETLTTRYLQSMASKCIVLGHAPREMIELFGYNPVVELDMPAAADQVIDMLDNYERFVPLIEKNYSTVIAGHTWAQRWARMAAVLFAD